MTINLPSTLKVCGLIYEIIVDDNLSLDRGATGQHHAEQLTITIQTHGVNNQRVIQTFLHEIIHAIDEHYLNGDLQEGQVRSLASGFYQVLVDNDLLKLGSE
jgi:hypothetical protein